MQPVPHSQVAPYPRFLADPIILLKEAARISGVTAQTLKNEAGRGKLTLIRISERRIGVRQSEWERYLDSRIWSAA
jgi:hypothetical protein